MATCKIINSPFLESCCLVSVDITGDTQKTLTFTLENGDVITSAFTDNNTTYTLAYTAGNLVFTPSTGSPTLIPIASFISSAAGNLIEVGPDGGFFVDDVTTTIINNPDGHRIATYINEDGVAFDIDETITQITGATLGADNVLTINYRNETGVSAATTVNLSTLAADVKVLSLQYDAATNTIMITNTDGTTNSVVLTDIIDVITHTLTMTGNTLESTVNGISDSVDVITSTSLSKIGSDLVMSVNGVPASIPISSIADGTETKINGGTNVTITGNGSTGNPYVINSVDTNTTYTYAISGDNLVVTDSTGATTTLAIPCTCDGSETKLNAGSNITLTGTGTDTDPYVINAASATTVTALNISGTTTKTVTITLSDGSTLTAPFTDLDTKYAFSISGNIITATGTDGSVQNLTLPASATPDGSETKVNAGTNVSITGSGTIASPYVVNVPNATDTVPGAVELSTNAEAVTGTNTTLAVTPAGVTAAINSAFTNCSGVAITKGSTIMTCPTNVGTDGQVLTKQADGTYAWEPAAPDTNTTYTLNLAGTTVSLNGSDGSVSSINLPGGTTDTNTTYTLTLSGNNLVFNGSDGTTNTLPIPCTCTGDETKISAGTGVSITGAGTTASPYVINSTGGGGGSADGSETKITVGAGLSISGTGTTASPYLITNTRPDTNTTYTYAVSGNNIVVTGSDGTTSTLPIPCTCTGNETKITAGTNTTITGSGTTASPYVINATGGSTTPDGTETKVIAEPGNPNIEVTGTGSTADPYVVSVPDIRHYVARYSHDFELDSSSGTATESIPRDYLIYDTIGITNPNLFLLSNFPECQGECRIGPISVPAEKLSVTVTPDRYFSNLNVGVRVQPVGPTASMIYFHPSTPGDSTCAGYLTGAPLTDLDGNGFRGTGIFDFTVHITQWP